MRSGAGPCFGNKFPKHRLDTRDHVDLGGTWRFAYTLDAPSRPFTRGREIERAGLEILPATVPGNFELDLLASGIIEEPFFGTNIAGLTRFQRAHVWYFTTFKAGRRPDRTAELIFEGLDCFAELFLNGEHIGSTDNMLVEHAFDVDSRLAGANELVVHIRPAVGEAKRFPYPPLVYANAANYESLYIRKAPHMYGWDIMPRAVSAGIWRPVVLHYRPLERIETAFLETTWIADDRSRAGLALSYRLARPPSAGDSYSIRIDGCCESSRFSETRPALFDAGRVTFTLDSPRLWWPRGRGNPDLYEIVVALMKNGAEIDRREFTHGIRTVRLDRTSIADAAGSGEFCFHVNGDKVFMMGSNWVPADAYHSRDAARIPRMLELAEDAGCNILRCWGGNVYEDDLFYETCDRKGIMVWQDFAMACAIYPQDADFSARLQTEARKVIRRLRRHPCLVLWCGDNECDCAYAWSGRNLDPNTNVLTRKVLPAVLREEDPGRPYLPSSPYIDEEAFKTGTDYLTENHLWGPRGYYKSEFYANPLCHFASEIGYHGCPSPGSIRSFISPDKLWPYQDNDEWTLHSTSPVPALDLYDYRVELMAKQIRELFGEAPDNLDEFAFASQAVQAEAKKFFIELFRGTKWRRTGIIWWNLIDGWPQFSDAVVDYYFTKKLAYHVIKRVQSPLCLVLREPVNSEQELIACNDTRDDLDVDYRVTDADDGASIAQGRGKAAADAVTTLARIPFSADAQRFYIIEWGSALGKGENHYLAGSPPFDLAAYRRWLAATSIRPEE